MDKKIKAKYSGNGTCFNLGYKSFPRNVWQTMTKKEFEVIVKMGVHNQFIYNHPLAFLLNDIQQDVRVDKDEPAKPTRKRSARKKKEKSE